MKIGWMELLVVLIIALVVLGPDQMPVYARKFGKALREFKKVSSDLTSEIRADIVEPLNEAAKPLKEAAAPINEAGSTLRSTAKDIQKQISDIGKEPPVKKTEEPEKTEEEKKEETL
ncbi:MAG: Sec-independent protein translocase protein TatB [Bulleidia sp.]